MYCSIAHRVVQDSGRYAMEAEQQRTCWIVHARASAAQLLLEDSLSPMASLEAIHYSFQASLVYQLAGGDAGVQT